MRFLIDESLPGDLASDLVTTGHDVLDVAGSPHRGADDAVIRARAREGKSLRRVDVAAEDPNLVKAAQRKFPSSWNRAVREAGLGGKLTRSVGGRVRRRGR